MTSEQLRNPPPPAAPGRRYSLGVVIGAAVAGFAIGALSVFAIAAPTWKIRVELPPPPYPAPLSSYLPPTPLPTITTPTTGPGGLPAPPFPPPGPTPR